MSNKTDKNNTNQPDKANPKPNLFSSSSSLPFGNLLQSTTNIFKPLTSVNTTQQKKQQKNLFNLFAVHQQGKGTIAPKKQQGTQQQKPKIFNNQIPQKRQIKQVQQTGPQFSFLFSQKEQPNMTKKKEVETKSPLFSFPPPQTKNNTQTIRKQIQPPKNLFASSTLEAQTKTIQTSKNVAEIFNRAPAGEISGLFNKETIKTKALIEQKNKKESLIFGQRAPSKDQLLKQIEQDLKKREGGVGEGEGEGGGGRQKKQQQKQILLNYREQHKNKIIEGLKKKNNIILNNNSDLHHRFLVMERIKQFEKENGIMRKQKKQLQNQIQIIHKRTGQQSEKASGKQKVSRPQFPQITPSISVNSILYKLCKFLPSNTIKDDDQKLKVKIQQRQMLEKQVQQLEKSLKQQEKQLQKKLQKSDIEENEIINELDDQKQLMEYLNGHLRSIRKKLQEQYQKLKGQVKQLKKKQIKKDQKPRISRGVSLIL